MKLLERRRSIDSMKSFYNWFYQFYGMCAKGLQPNINAVLSEIFTDKKKYEKSTAIEYACGTGILSRLLADYFYSVDGRDLSINMLNTAKELTKKEGKTINFQEGNVLEIKEGEKSFDYAFISFALHLFPLADIQTILKNLLRTAKKEVIIIDHSLQWDIITAFVEWIEGSYYDHFIKLDFQQLAKDVGAKNFTFEEISNCSVLRFSK